ncbi:tetratricopeptide repeat protein, partial [bacterium]|nr:tetratricopeptide repeat protein [bacterium]
MKTVKSTAVLIILISIILIPGCETISKMNSLERIDQLKGDFYFFLYSEDYDEALNILDRIESHSEMIEGYNPDCKCEFAFYAGRYDEALVEVNQLLEGWRDPRHLRIRGNIYTSMHRLDDARQDYEAVLNPTPLDLNFQRTSGLLTSCYTSLIELELEDWQFTDAIVLLKKLRTEFPRSMGLNRLEFEFAMKERNFRDASLALDLYDQSISTDLQEPRFIDVYHSGTNLYRARLEFEQGDPVDARAFLEKYHSERPDSTRYYTWNTDFDWVLGDFES